MGAGAYLLGLALLTATLVAVGWAAALVVRRRLAHLRAAPRALAWALLATAGVILVHLAPAALGVLGRGSVVAAAALALAAAARLPPARLAGGPGRVEPDTREPGGRLSWTPATVAVCVVAVYALAYVSQQATVAIVHYDFVTFHMPGVVRWIQTGTVWQVDQFVSDHAYGNYPNNGDLILLAAVLPWHNDFLARFVDYPFLAMTGLAVYGVGRELRLPPTACALAGCAVTAIPIVLLTTFLALPDLVLYASFAAGLLFLVRHLKNDRRSELVLAGIGLGIAFGTKWYGLTCVVAALLVWAAAMLAAGRAPRTVARRAAALTGLVFGAGGFWLVRNLVESGNPLFPVKLAPFGVTVFDAPRDVARDQTGFSIAHYLGDGHVLSKYFGPHSMVAHVLGAPALALTALALFGAAVAGVQLWRWRAEARRDGIVVAAIACAALIVAAYVVTPYTAQGLRGAPLLAWVNTRYVVPALLVAAPAAGWALGRFARARRAAEILVVIAVVHGVARGTARRIIPEFGVSAGRLVATAAVLAVVAIAVRALVRRPHATCSRPRPVTVALATVALAALVAGGYADQRRFNDRRYRGFDPALDWAIAHARSGHRVALAGGSGGVSPVLALFGPRFGNSVVFVGRFERHMLRAYTEPRAFQAALERGRFDVLVLGINPYAISPQALHGEELAAVAAGFRRVAASPNLILLTGGRAAPARGRRGG